MESNQSQEAEDGSYLWWDSFFQFWSIYSWTMKDFFHVVKLQ